MYVCLSVCLSLSLSNTLNAYTLMYVLTLINTHKMPNIENIIMIVFVIIIIIIIISDDRVRSRACVGYALLQPPRQRHNILFCYL